MVRQHACIFSGRLRPVVAAMVAAGLAAGCSRVGAPRADRPVAPITTGASAGGRAAGTVVAARAVASTAVSLIDATPAGGAVDLEVYELGNPAVIAALEAAKRRGVVVRAILDATERQSLASGPALRRAGVATETMRVEGGIDHVKLLVAAGRVLMGGVNLGSGSSYTTDMDVELPAIDVSYARSIFAADWRAASSGTAPSNGSYGPFVTGGAILPAVLATIGAASRGDTCYVVANYLSDRTVRDAAVAAARRGAAVDVVLNPTAYGEAKADAALAAGGAHVRLAPQSPYLHAKVLACSGPGGWYAVVGSANFSYHGMALNHELDVVLSGGAAGAVGAWAESIWRADG